MRTLRFFPTRAAFSQLSRRCSLSSRSLETEPGVKGNTATNVLKPATVETGAVVKVPIFIEQGERIQIDTRTGEYLGRSKTK